MSEDLLLTELCMICHTKPYKYCCPRCSSRTCSLPCIKRHKQWASCNGVRDPTAYIKRSELATPKGIDHDYNYLTSIERQLDSAERDCQSRGILLFDEGKKGHKAAKGEVPLKEAIRQCRVVVDTAPKGMSRQKQNATYWDKRKKRIVWTVEWVHRDGSREIGSCPETTTIDAAYAELATPQKRNAATRAGRPSKKHKPNVEVPLPPTLSIKPRPEDPPTNASAVQAPQAPSTQPQEPKASLVPFADQPTSAALDRQRSSTPVTHNNPSPPPLHFYLLLPSTPTSYRVLIPLSPRDTLSNALTDRLVLEFPTIYALKQPPDRLPTGFTTEEEYLNGIAEKGNMDRHLDGLLHGTQGWEDKGVETTGERHLDESALRDVLKKDLISEVDAG